MKSISPYALALACAASWTIGATAATAQSADPIAVALMTGFNPGSNPGMAILRARLQTVFGGGGVVPPFTSQVFTYTNQAGASAFLSAAGPSAKRVLIGHSFGASSNFTLAQNVLGPAGMNVHLQISVDWVSQSSPFTATTPTLPSQILAGFHYKQTSTGFLEPVPASAILGAKRDLNMETLFADPSLTHTSVDCDPRVHELVVARIRELFLPPPFPGTDEDLDLFCRFDTLNTPCVPASGIATAGVLTTHATQTITAGQLVTLRTISPAGVFNAGVFGILGEVYATGATPVSALPGIASSLDMPALMMLVPSGVQVPPAHLEPLPAVGFNVQFCWPAGLVGISFLTQTVFVGPAAANGLYASSLGMELRGV